MGWVILYYFKNILVYLFNLTFFDADHSHISKHGTGHAASSCTNVLSRIVIFGVAGSDCKAVLWCHHVRQGTLSWASVLFPIGWKAIWQTSDWQPWNPLTSKPSCIRVFITAPAGTANAADIWDQFTLFPELLKEYFLCYDTQNNFFNYFIQCRMSKGRDVGAHRIKAMNVLFHL